MIEMKHLEPLFEKRLVELGHSVKRGSADPGIVGDWPTVAYELEIAGVACILSMCLIRTLTPEARQTITTGLLDKVKQQHDLGSARVTHVQLLLDATIFCDLVAPSAEQAIEPALASALKELWDHRRLGTWIGRVQGAEATQEGEATP